MGGPAWLQPKVANYKETKRIKKGVNFKKAHDGGLLAAFPTLKPSIGRVKCEQR